MQYNPAHSYHNVENRPLPNWVKYLSASAVAMLAVYGLSTHHVLLVAVGLIAVLAFQNRVEGLNKTPSAKSSSARIRIDGGSFPGTDSAAPPRNAGKPKVLDGGSLEHHALREQGGTGVENPAGR